MLIANFQECLCPPFAACCFLIYVLLLVNECDKDFKPRLQSGHFGKAKRAASNDPVIITDRGKPAHVLLSIAEYQKLTGGNASIVELLADKQAAAIEFEVPRARTSSLKIPELPVC
jgi:prevent-host-death family protein